jgi:hypothetical protein
MAGAPKKAERRTERFSLPLTPAEMQSIETMARIWGRQKTDFARELLLGALANLPPPEPRRALPVGG